MIIKLLRHGESKANTGEINPQEHGDYRIPLTYLGEGQAIRAGEQLGREFIEDAVIYSSPYRRARQTLLLALTGAGLDSIEGGGVRILEDPRLREVEHGYSDYAKQIERRRTHGWFYYRFKGGESPADCFDRCSTFVDSMYRQVQRKSKDKILVVTHGLTIRCLVMRYLHLSVEEFEAMANPPNCQIVTLGLVEDLPEEPLYRRGRWGVVGLTERED